MMIPGSKVNLREKRNSDAADDYAWQKDPELAELDASVVPDITYSQFVNNYGRELWTSTRSRRFAIENKEGKHIGNCACYGIDEIHGEGEIGIMIGDRNYWSKGYGEDAIKALVKHIFETTHLRRLHLKTLDWNARAQKCFLKCGFTPFDYRDAEGYSFVMMQLTRQQWRKNSRLEETVAE